ncbi:MAG: DUF1849 family protein [Proteobacteria bacterium]|nr:DUF1849 family protein [Pseudomonadota bacterium]
MERIARVSLYKLPLRPLALAAALVVGLVAAAPAAAGLVPHRAIYSVKLESVRANAGFVDVRGAAKIVLEKTCDGWIMTQELTMDMGTAAGGTVKQDIRSAGWESLDGKSYRFAVRHTMGRQVEGFKGEARLGAAGKPGKATFKVPPGKTMVLPEGTLFPAAHTAWLIERALAGDRQAPGIVFDGSDGQGARKVIAFIGPRVESGRHRNKGLGALVQRPGWNIRMAYYPLDSRAPAPEYEIEVLQLDNGVAPRVVVDYPQLTVVMTMEKIEAIPAPRC